MFRRPRRMSGLALLAGLTAATSAFAQVSAPALAPQDGLPLNLPGPLDTEPRRSTTLAPVSPGSLTKTVLSLSCLFFENSPAIETGLHWRIFADQQDLHGNHALVYESTEARPFVTLDPGGYIVHVVYGLASETRHIILGTESVGEQIVLNAGALRFTGVIGDKPIATGDLTFEVTTSSDESEAVAQVKANELVRLKAGSYQVTSTYGQANARVISEIRVEPGKLTEASVLHKAGKVDLRLTGQSGAEITSAIWSILTPGGDIVVDTLDTLTDIVLAEGEYVAVARYEGQTFQQQFMVETGGATRVDLAMN